MKRLLIFLSLLLCFHAKAQQPGNPLSELRDTTKENILLGAAYVDMSSNVVTGKLFQNILFTSVISRESRESVLTKLKDNNRAGVSAGGSIMARIGNFTMGYNYRRQEGMEFSTDLYKLLAFGNADYAGEKMILSPTQYKKMEWQELRGGISGMMNKKRTLFGGIGLSVVGGSSYRQLQLQESSLYTSIAADTLHLIFDAQAHISDGAATLKGIGLGFNGFLKYFFGKNSLSISLDDAGFIHWSQNSSKSLELKDDLEFTGMDISNIGQSNGSGSWQNLPDSLANEIENGWKSGSFTQAMPIRIGIGYSRVINTKTVLHTGVNYMLFYSSTPQVFAIGNTRLSKHIEVIYGLNAGGYSVWGIDAGIKLNFNKIGISLSTTHFEGLIMPKKTTGESLYFTLSYKL